MPPFVFNAYSSLLLPFFVQGLVVSGLLLVRGRRHGTPADGWLALLLLLSTARLAQWMLGFGGWYDAHDARTTFMFYFPFGNWLALGPGLYFYFRSLTNQEFRFGGRDGRHFLPALLYLAGCLLLWAYDVGWQHLVLGRPLPGHFGTKGSLATWLDASALSRGAELLGYVSVLLYAALTLRHYRAYRRYVNDNFSDTERLRFTWLRNVLVAVPAGLLVTLLFEAVNAAIRPLDYYQAWYDYLFTGILIYYLSIAGLLANHRLTAPLHFQPTAPAPDEAPPERAVATSVSAPESNLPAAALTFGTASVISPTGPSELPAAAVAEAEVIAAAEAAAPDRELERWTEKLRAHMAAARPYLAPELTLSELAAQLRTNTSWLSRVINTGCGQNFNDFVNEYRVREAEQRLRDPQFRHYTLLAVALESGFNSKSTFNRVFRKLRGLTPSEAAGRNP
ncbi:helix-turn-helix domain-containing protein [Hymenobacter jeollabukensis]|uniref:Helix-turn-helix transcriptional regulator n=1 Tax=Hymenobacter jeollabukensis TaxID=2025313 RepID=A0A5R8WWJ8_9BACT|nr:helix-turn-helix transcriptional regulator [Hymenobacter jeollabukensis]TLM96900.1 helix-turn-helix transcriptional regulator [Hymenobacter jeollabukensis]